jgi:dTDP-4-dehydrorhamnose reductase
VLSVKVLITGASGQVGAALSSCPPADVELSYAAHSELDIADAQQVRRVLTDICPDAIINAAAYTAVDRAESEPERAREVNEIGPRNISQAAAQIGARVIQISTDFVFDGESSQPYAPDAPTRPLSVYGKTKLAGELAVSAVLPRRFVVLRTAWVYASSGHNFVRTMLRLMKEKGGVRVVADQIGSPTAAASVAAAVWQIVARPDIVGVLHWTDAGVASWYDFAVAIAEEAADLGMLSKPVTVAPITTSEYPTPARRPRFSVLDCRGTVTATGMTATHWRSNLRRVLGEMQIA